MPKVFAPQVPSELDQGTRLWIPKINLAPAKKFGEVVILLPPQAARLGLEALLNVLKEKLRDITDDDWIIAIGDPSFIAICSCLAYKKTGVLRLLKWERQTLNYIPTEVKI